MKTPKHRIRSLIEDVLYDQFTLSNYPNYRINFETSTNGDEDCMEIVLYTFNKDLIVKGMIEEGYHVERDNQ